MKERKGRGLARSRRGGVEGKKRGRERKGRKEGGRGREGNQEQLKGKKA